MTVISFLSRAVCIAAFRPPIVSAAGCTLHRRVEQTSVLLALISYSTTSASSICAIGSARCIEWDEDTEMNEKPHSDLAPERRSQKNVARDSFCSGPPPYEVIGKEGLAWWAHQGSNLGPAD